jgi:hypothetical protein
MCVLVVLTSLMFNAYCAAVAASTQAGKVSDSWMLVAPKRRAPDEPPAPPPELPDSASRIMPATIDIVVRRTTTGRRVQLLRQTVSRTAERIHLAGSDGREWLFERNSVDPRRVSATLVEHPSKVIVLHSESDLRMALGIRGWADVLALGFDSGLLSGYKRTQEARTIAGIRFARYATGSAGAAIREVWWSDEQALPSLFAIADKMGITRFSVERIRTGVDAALLQSPEVRFTKYPVLDLANWLERQ